MDNVTQQNAALVEQAAAAAGSLQDQAANLLEVVSVFKLGNSQMQPGAARSKAGAVKLDNKPKLPRIAAKKVATAPTKRIASAAPHGDDWEQF
jgi:methyl-accepting chemotaxis protein